MSEVSFRKGSIVEISYPNHDSFLAVVVKGETFSHYIGRVLVSYPMPMTDRMPMYRQDYFWNYNGNIYNLLSYNFQVDYVYGERCRKLEGKELKEAKRGMEKILKLRSTVKLLSKF